MKNYTAIIALALALPAGFANAQQPEGRPAGPPTGDGRPPIDRPFDGPGRAEKPPMPHMPPFFAALDKNGDGVISEDEIAAASESLRKLAAEHGGKLTIRDLLGPPPEGMRRDGIRPPGAPPDGQPPREGEKPRSADRPRDGVRPEGAPRDGERRPEGFRPRDGEQPRNAERPRDGEKPKDGDRPRDGERGDKPRGDAPRDGVRPDAPPRSERRDGDSPRPVRPDAPRGERPPGDAPRPDGEPRRPNPEG